MINCYFNNRTNMLNMYRCIVLAVVFFIITSSFAQVNGRLNEKSLVKEVPFTITQYSTTEGLVQSQIVDIEPKTDGTLFLSTANGISTFNGFEFKELEVDKKYRNYFFIHLFWNEKYSTLLGCTDKVALLSPIFKIEIISSPRIFTSFKVIPYSLWLYGLTLMRKNLSSEILDNFLDLILNLYKAWSVAQYISLLK